MNLEKYQFIALNEDYNNYIEEYNKKIKEVKELNENIKIYQKKNEELENNIKIYQKKTEEQENNIKLYLNKIEELENNIKLYQKKNEELENKIKVYQKNNEELEKNIKIYQTKIEELEINIKLYEKKNEEQENKIKVYQKKNEEQENKILEINLNNNSSGKMKENMFQIILNETFQIKKNEINYDEKLKEIDLKNETINHLEIEIKEKQKCIDTLNITLNQQYIEKENAIKNELNEKNIKESYIKNYEDLLKEIFQILEQNKIKNEGFLKWNLDEQKDYIKEKTKNLKIYNSTLEESIIKFKKEIEEMKSKEYSSLEINDIKIKNLIKEIAKEELSEFISKKNNEDYLFSLKTNKYKTFKENFQIKSKVFEFYEKKNEDNSLNFISLTISKVDDLLENGWKINKCFKEGFKEDLKEENKKGLTIGVLGDTFEGKTYFINKIFKCNLPLESTKNINYYFFKKNIRIIDIPGSNQIIFPTTDLKDNQKKELNKIILETKKKDFIIENFVIDNSIINIMVISSFNLMIKKKIGKIIRIFNENYKNSSVIKSLYIIHNNIKIKSDEDYYNYIKNNFPKEYYYNKDNLIFTEILGEEAEHKFEVLHFVPKTYKKEDEVIMTINTQIYSHLQIDICNFDEMVLNSFQKIDKILFNNECEIKIEDDNIKIKKKQNKNNSNSELENFSFNKTYVWSSIRITIPSYCCYVDENNDFIIQIELAGFNKCNISYKIIESEYKFFLVCKKNKIEGNKKMIQSNISENDINYQFKIPITFIIDKKYYKNNFDKGIMTFYYKILSF